MQKFFLFKVVNANGFKTKEKNCVLNLFSMYNS